MNSLLFADPPGTLDSPGTHDSPGIHDPPGTHDPPRTHDSDDRIRSAGEVEWGGRDSESGTLKVLLLLIIKGHSLSKYYCTAIVHALVP